jgi:hypothetical protein
VALPTTPWCLLGCSGVDVQRQRMPKLWWLQVRSSTSTVHVCPWPCGAMMGVCQQAAGLTRPQQAQLCGCEYTQDSRSSSSSSSRSGCVCTIDDNTIAGVQRRHGYAHNLCVAMSAATG